MSWEPDDNPRIEHPVFIQRLPRATDRPRLSMMFCHATGCEDPAEWAIGAGDHRLRLCPEHMEFAAHAMSFLTKVRS
jgi:hypothetical protein